LNRPIHTTDDTKPLLCTFTVHRVPDYYTAVAGTHCTNPRSVDLDGWLNNEMVWTWTEPMKNVTHASTNPTWPGVLATHTQQQTSCFSLKFYETRTKCGDDKYVTV